MTKINGKEEYNFSSNEIEQNIHKLSQLGITEFSIHDEEIAKNKQKLIKLMKLFASKAPDVYVSFFVDANVIDKELIQAASQVFCSLDIPLKASQKGDKVLFDKKFYAKKVGREYRVSKKSLMEYVRGERKLNGENCVVNVTSNPQHWTFNTPCDIVCVAKNQKEVS